MKKAIYLFALILISCNLFAQKSKGKGPSTETPATKLTSAALGKLEARHIGPAVTGGRITSIDGFNADPRIMYIGTAGGGVWKTTTGGAQFQSVFDKYCQSIGSVAVDQTNAD